MSVVLKRIVKGVEKVQFTWKRGSKKVSISEEANIVYVGLDDVAYKCALTCEETERFTNAKEVVVSVEGEEEGYLVAYEDRIDFLYVDGTRTVSQDEERAGTFTNLQLLASPTRDSARFMATAQKDDKVFRFQTDGGWRSCPSGISSRAVGYDNHFGFTLLSVLFQGENGELRTKLMRSGDCVRELGTDLTTSGEFDIFTIDSDLSVIASRVDGEVHVSILDDEDIRFWEANPVVAPEDSRFEIAASEKGYVLGILFDGKLSFHTGSFSN